MIDDEKVIRMVFKFCIFDFIMIFFRVRNYGRGFGFKKIRFLMVFY